MYFQILATYFWLDLYVLIDFFVLVNTHHQNILNTLVEVRKKLYVCERFLEQIQHILCDLVTMGETFGR